MIPPLFCHPVYICGLCHIHLCTPIILEFCGPAGSQLLPQEMPPSLLFLTHFTTTFVRARWGLLLCCHKWAQPGMCLSDNDRESVAVRIRVDFHLWLVRLGKRFSSLPFRLAPDSKCLKLRLCHFKAVSRSDR